MTTSTTTTPTEAVEHLPIEAIVPDPANRKVVLDAQFVASVRTHGVIQPLLVTPHAEQEGRYELVAGHRRLGAARKLGLQRVPALVRVLTEEEKLTLALVDNIQRNALRPIEIGGIASDASFDTAERPDQHLLGVGNLDRRGPPAPAVTWASTLHVANDATMSE